MDYVFVRLLLRNLPSLASIPIFSQDFDSIGANARR